MKKNFLLVMVTLIFFGTLYFYTTLSKELAPDKDSGKTIILYTSWSMEEINPIILRFKELTGIEVKAWKGSGTKVITRILEEKKANKLQTDLVLLNASRMSFLEKEKILVKYLNQPSHPVLTHYITLAYNTNEIATPPRTYYDLLKPEYQNKLGLEIDSPEWEIALKEVLGKEYFDILADKVANQEIRSVDGKQLFAQMVISGEIPIAINLANNYIEKAKNKGAPVEWLPLEPVVALHASVALTKDSPEAKAFIEFLLSKEGQYLISQIGRGAPIDESIDSPLYTGFEVVTPDFNQLYR